jgi:hypothetical protein
MVGPYEPNTSPVEFEESPAEGLLASVIDELRNEGLAVHTGRWTITGQPRVVLFDYRSAWPRIADIKYRLWHEHDIALPGFDHDDRGLFVIRRRYRTFESAAQELTERLWQFTQLDQRGRIEMRNRVERSSEQFDWSEMYVHYMEAYSKCQVPSAKSKKRCSADEGNSCLASGTRHLKEGTNGHDRGLRTARRQRDH